MRMKNEVMCLIIIVLLAGLTVNVCGDDEFALDDNNYYFGLLNVDEDSVKEDKVETVQEEPPKLIDGLWKCGNCTDIDESKVLFSETLELDTNYEDNGYELQVEFAVNNMRCVVIDAGAINVTRISGACSGEDVILSITQNCTADVKIY